MVAGGYAQRPQGRILHGRRQAVLDGIAKDAEDLHEGQYASST